MSQLESEFKRQSIDDIIHDAIENHGIEEFYCLYSTGSDSSYATHYVATHYPKYFKGCVVAMTGSGHKDVRYIAIEQCKRFGWPLWFTWPRMPDENGEGGERWIDIILSRGFGGAGNHKIWMGKTKYFPWRRFMQERYDKKPAFISGVRHRESPTRQHIKTYSQQPIDWDGKLCFVKPLFWLNGFKVKEYVLMNDLKISTVHDYLGISGDSFCGCNAEGYELQMIKQMAKEGLEKGEKNGYYYIYDNIKWTERLVKEKIIELERLIKTKYARGKPEARKTLSYLYKYNTWNHGPSTKEQDEQTNLTDFVEINVCGESCEVGMN